jgi:hypothetical protein
VDVVVRGTPAVAVEVEVCACAIVLVTAAAVEEEKSQILRKTDNIVKEGRFIKTPFFNNI